MAGDYKSNCTCVENTFHSLTFSTFWETASAFSSHRYYARFFSRSLATYPTYNIQRDRPVAWESFQNSRNITWSCWFCCCGCWLIGVWNICFPFIHTYVSTTCVRRPPSPSPYSEWWRYRIAMMTPRKLLSIDCTVPTHSCSFELCIPTQFFIHVLMHKQLNNSKGSYHCWFDIISTLQFRIQDGIKVVIAVNA